jgi:hypothetical protein
LFSRGTVGVNEQQRKTILCEHEKRDIQVMSSGDTLKMARTSSESSPVGSARERAAAPPGSVKRLLHIKGFGGGVPQTPKQPP